jgi:FkbM family methyltransferase
MSEHSVQEAFQAAVRQQNAGDARQAEALYRQVLARAPGHADAHFNLGIVLQAQGRADDALECYFRALKMKRHAHPVYSRLGQVFHDLGWLDEAAACHRRAADLLRISGDAQASVEAYERALEANPRDVAIRFHLGGALLRLNRHAQAARRFDQVLAQVGDFAAYARFLVAGKSVATVRIGGEQLQYHVGQVTRNSGMDVCHVNGRVYEREELDYCRTQIKPRAVIVDVGANTGNHLVYFARFLAPALILPVEPHPEAIRELRANIALNAITCVDERCLGFGAGARRGAFRLVEGIDLAQAELRADPGGEVQVAPLDELIGVPVDFIKIDVEGMEIEVLKGARRLITECRPRIMIEVARRNLEPFRRACAELGYRVAQDFAREGYANYFLVPAG